MELLDRYLQAVRKHLPWKRQDDIVAELKANLESQLEEKEAALGRPLTTGEAEDWLRDLGSPLEVATRYQPQQYLIGPATFPLYLYVLRIACSIATIVYVVVNAITLAVQSPSADAIATAVFRIPYFLMNVAAWVTLIFAIIEYVSTHYPGKLPPVPYQGKNWSPNELPPLEKPVTGRKRSFAHAVAEVVLGFVFLAWLLLVPKYPYLIFGPGAQALHASPFRLAGNWWPFYWCVVAMGALQLGWRCVDLSRCAWHQNNRVQETVISALGLLPLWVLLSVPNHEYLLLRHPDVDQARYGSDLAAINHGIQIALLLACAIAILEFAAKIWKWALAQWRTREARQ